MSQSTPVANKDVENQLDHKTTGAGGYQAPDKKHDDAKKHDIPEKAIIPHEHRSLVYNSMVGFAVCFLASFAGMAAYTTYQANVNATYTAPTCHSFKLLFYANMVMGVMYGLCSLLCIIPGPDKMFWGLFWDPKTFPAMRTNGNLFMRQMGVVLLGLAVAQVAAPSNTGVGLCALCVCCACLWNFILASVFGHYKGVRYHKITFPNPGFEVRMVDQFLVGGFVFIALLVVGLERTNLFSQTWKNDSQQEQTWLFYLNNVTGLMYLPLGIMLSTQNWNLWFWKFHLKTPPFQNRDPIDCLGRNMGLMVIGLSTAALIAPNNPGVGIVQFWVHLLLAFPFLMTIMGLHGEVNNKFLWVGWLLNTILFTVLYAVALRRLDNCDATDATCGMFRNWTDQPWRTHTASDWAGCVINVVAP
jgi:hypothetical protein